MMPGDGQGGSVKHRVFIGMALFGLALASTAFGLINETIKLNGKPFADGIIIQDGLHVPLTDVAKAVNGNGELGPRLTLKDGQLVGVTAGGCGACAIKVQKTGTALGAVKTVEGKQVIDVESLKVALGGTLIKSEAGTNIKAAPCTTCALSVVAATPPTR
jgi:hypothetical protein